MVSTGYQLPILTTVKQFKKLTTVGANLTLTYSQIHLISTSYAQV